MIDLAFHQRICELLAGRLPFATAEVVATRGSAPRDVGARMIVRAEGATEFTIGGGPFEAEVTRDALALLRTGTVACKDYRLVEEELGMHCAGEATVLMRAYRPLPRLLVFGGGHVGQALASMAAEVGLFQIAVVDDREEFADPARHPRAHLVLHTDPEYRRGVPEPDPETYVAIVTRCHATDELLLRRFVGAPVAYLAMVGSESKWRRFRKELETKGVPAEALERVHSPAGLPIGGKSPGEIAVSILGEIIQAVNERTPRESSTGNRLRGPR